MCPARARSARGRPGAGMEGVGAGVWRAVGRRATGCAWCAPMVHHRRPAPAPAGAAPPRRRRRARAGGARPPLAVATARIGARGRDPGACRSIADPLGCARPPAQRPRQRPRRPRSDGRGLTCMFAAPAGRAVARGAGSPPRQGQSAAGGLWGVRDGPGAGRGAGFVCSLRRRGRRSAPDWSVGRRWGRGCAGSPPPGNAPGRAPRGRGATPDAMGRAQDP
jgi:hypothetical protein